MSAPRWYGQAGHFCASYNCQFHLHTHVNGYCISTVGEYFPRNGDKQDTVGVGRLYETMVFQVDAEDAVLDWSGLWTEGYNDRDAANAGHAAMVKEWGSK